MKISLNLLTNICCLKTLLVTCRAGGGMWDFCAVLPLQSTSIDRGQVRKLSDMYARVFQSYIDISMDYLCPLHDSSCHLQLERKK